ncbi:MAG: hypothetical protein ACOYJL_04275 [Tractidigestivibacter sp.]|uniref:hypothetical protein n=1 Tax=Tractidigestivibacter sp. TaxID=2847320 RepID=UPI003D91AD69
MCDISALHYWRTRSDAIGTSSGRVNAAPSRRSHPSIDIPTSATIKYLDSLGFVQDGEVSLLVSSPADRRVLKNTKVTVIGAEVPSRSFVRALGQVYVVSPELLFVMAASKLSFPRLLELGHELCGTYRMTSPHPTYNVEPLTSVAALRSYAQKAKGIRGRRSALLACKYIADDSASPAETALSIMFRLPLRYGGYGLGMPLLNHELTLNETASRLLGGRGAIKPDFYWAAARYPAEYDSSLYHSTREQSDVDERRRNAYAALGMGVTVVRPRHLCQIELLDGIAASVCKNTGIKTYHLPADYRALHESLFQEVCRYWTELHDRYPGAQDYLLESAAYSGPEGQW